MKQFARFKHVLFAPAVMLALLAAGSAFSLQAQIRAALPANQPVEVEVITIGFHGVTPSQITRNPGKFVLAIRSRTPGLSSMSLQLVDASGNAVQKGITPNSLRRRRRSSSVLDLQPGDYQLRAAESGRVLCAIHIQ